MAAANTAGMGFGLGMIVLLAGACGLTSDQWFTVTITNDTGSRVELLEPCPGCQRPGPLTTLGEGESYRLPVLANGGVKTYLVSDASGRTLRCLPLAFSHVPANQESSLSKLERPCTSQHR
jgi:hypothetical protein